MLFFMLGCGRWSMLLTATTSRVVSLAPGGGVAFKKGRLFARWDRGEATAVSPRTGAEKPDEVIELRFAVAGSASEEGVSAEELSGCLMELGAQSVDASDEDAGTEREKAVYREPETGYDVFADPAWRSSEFWSRCVVRALVPTRLEATLLAQLEDIYGDRAPSFVSRRPLDASIDWVREQERLRPPLKLGRMRVILPWHDVDDSLTELGDLRVEGGAAFGTGEHPTTRMCCDWIQSGTVSLPAMARVLDYGAGSGILALAALKAGAAQAVGVDVDVDAVLAAKRNADSNGFSPDEARFHLPAQKLTAALPQHPAQSARLDAQLVAPLPDDEPDFDVVVANILLNPLRELAPTLASFVRPGHGVLAVSGIRLSQFDDFSAIYQPFFADIDLLHQEDGWILVVCRNRHHHPPSQSQEGEKEG